MTVPPTEHAQRLTDAMGRYADGDPEAFVVVYQSLHPIVARCMRRWIADRALADDLVQDTFLRLHRNRHRYRPGAPVAPWVLTIARRLSIDALRRRATNRAHLTRDGELPERREDPIEPPDLTPLLTELRAAVAALPASLRPVVEMHKLEGRPMAEVADALGINEGAARVRAHRGYQRLKARLGEFVRREADR